MFQPYGPAVVAGYAPAEPVRHGVPSCGWCGMAIDPGSGIWVERDAVLAFSKKDGTPTPAPYNECTGETWLHHGCRFPWVLRQALSEPAQCESCKNPIGPDDYSAVIASNGGRVIRRVHKACVLDQACEDDADGAERLYQDALRCASCGDEFSNVCSECEEKEG